ncbi:MAG: hypothetical protein NTZ15_12525 [Burkholderiales bacterium]|nr:hypothetical protein [Burkholderiales bacterium]
MLDPNKLVTGSPLLHMPGLMRLRDAAALAGLTVRQLFDELASRRAELGIRATGWIGADVPHEELAIDDPTSPVPVIDLGETLAGRSKRSILGELLVRHEALALVDGDTFDDCVFYKDAGRRHAVVVDLPGVSAELGELLARRTDVEAIRNTLAAHVTPAMLAPKSVASAPTIAPAPPIDAATMRELIIEGHMGAAYGHRNTPVSALLTAYHAEKKPRWSVSTIEQNQRMGAFFIEAMGDLALGKIDRSTIKAYHSKLQEIPTNLHRVKNKHPTLDLDGLIKLAAQEGLELIREARANVYAEKMGEAFVWAKVNGYMTDNPAANIAATTNKPTTSKREKRDDFDAATLERIFNQPWFLEGKGQPTKSGRYYSFQPCYYWMPLLALYTGARLNEIAQAHLKDVTQTDAGQWYLDLTRWGTSGCFPN